MQWVNAVLYISQYNDFEFCDVYFPNAMASTFDMCISLIQWIQSLKCAYPMLWGVYIPIAMDSIFWMSKFPMQLMQLLRCVLSNSMHVTFGCVLSQSKEFNI